MKKILVTFAAIALAPLAQAMDMQSMEHKSGHTMDHMEMEQKAAVSSATATGTVKKLSPEKGTIVIAHDPVPALGWPSMIMPFKASTEAMAGLQPGDSIDFDFTTDGTVITEIRKL